MCESKVRPNKVLEEAHICHQVRLYSSVIRLNSTVFKWKNFNNNRCIFCLWNQLIYVRRILCFNYILLKIYFCHCLSFHIDKIALSKIFFKAAAFVKCLTKIYHHRIGGYPFSRVVYLIAKTSIKNFSLPTTPATNLSTSRPILLLQSTSFFGFQWRLIYLPHGFLGWRKSRYSLNLSR
jgi:hypothetical protein